MPRDWLGRTSPKWPILCRVGRKTLTQSRSWCVDEDRMCSSEWLPRLAPGCTKNFEQAIRSQTKGNGWNPGSPEKWLLCCGELSSYTKATSECTSNGTFFDNSDACLLYETFRKCHIRIVTSGYPIDSVAVDLFLWLVSYCTVSNIVLLFFRRNALQKSERNLSMANTKVSKTSTIICEHTSVLSVWYL